jgi:hypothetical protein
VVRGDLSPAQQAVQAAHAALAFAAAHPEAAAHECPLALLEAPDELALCWLAEDAQRAGAAYAAFFEPDLGHALTAIALEPAADRLARRFPLALREGGEQDDGRDNGPAAAAR